MPGKDPAEISFPATLKYGPEHEWSSIGGDGVVTTGITDFAQDELGEIQFLQIPPVGTSLEKGEPMAEVESSKTSSEVYAPCSGEVVAANDDLVREPEKINSDPYGSWFVRIRPSRAQELDELVDADEYRRRVG